MQWIFNNLNHLQYSRGIDENILLCTCLIMKIQTAQMWVWEGNTYEQFVKIWIITRKSRVWQSVFGDKNWGEI